MSVYQLDETYKLYDNEFYRYYKENKAYYKNLVLSISCKLPSDSSISDNFIDNLTKELTHYKLVNYSDGDVKFTQRYFKAQYTNEDLKSKITKCANDAITITSLKSGGDIIIKFSISRLNLLSREDKLLYNKYHTIYEKLNNYHDIIINKFNNDIEMWKIKCQLNDKLLPFNLEQYLLPIPL
jgi:hypothetical protein